MWKYKVCSFEYVVSFVCTDFDGLSSTSERWCNGGCTQLTSSGMALVDGIMATGFHTNDVSHFYRKIRIKVLTSYVVGRVEELEYVRKCVTKNGTFFGFKYNWLII